MEDLARPRKTITLDDVIDAIEQNGYIQGYGDFFKYTGLGDKTIGSACAIGQAALNLDVDEYHLFGQLNTAFGGLGYKISEQNDHMKWELKRIAKYLRRNLRKSYRQSELVLLINKHDSSRFGTDKDKITRIEDYIDVSV